MTHYVHDIATFICNGFRKEKYFIKCELYVTAVR